jgi:hypothetical protein
MVTGCVQTCAVSEQHRLPDPVAKKAKEIRDENDYNSVGEVIRTVFKEAGYNV